MSLHCGLRDRLLRAAERAARPAVTLPCPRAARLRRLPPRGGLAGLLGVQGKGEQARALLQSPGLPQPCPAGVPPGSPGCGARYRGPITPFPRWLLAISVAETGRQDRTPSRGVLAPFTPQPASARLFLHGLVFFPARSHPSRRQEPDRGPHASFPCHKTTKWGVKRRAGLGQRVDGSGHTPHRGSSVRPRCPPPDRHPLAVPPPCCPS